MFSNSFTSSTRELSILVFSIFEYSKMLSSNNKFDIVSSKKETFINFEFVKVILLNEQLLNVTFVNSQFSNNTLPKKVLSKETLLILHFLKCASLRVSKLISSLSISSFSNNK